MVYTYVTSACGGVKMKEMVYTSRLITDILYMGEYKEHLFCILSLGTHPTAYVECKLKNCFNCYDERLKHIIVHGGFTFFGKRFWDNEKNYLGWDYAHFMDYLGFSPFVEGKKWTTAEIYEEVKAVIDQLEGIENKHQRKKACKLLQLIKGVFKWN